MNIPRFIDNETLKRIRENTDWQALFNALQLERDERRSKLNDWWARSPLSNEETPSFHLGSDGKWYCWSTDQGGGPVELVQAVFKAQHGKIINCYEAGRWLLENGVSHLDPNEVARAESKQKIMPGVGQQSIFTHIGAGERKDRGGAAARSEKGKGAGDGQKSLPVTVNAPIRQNLVPKLTGQGTHPEFTKRAISQATCQYLGCGYIADGKPPMAGRICFQVRGVVETDSKGSLSPVILTHLGRSTTPEQEQVAGKWWHYPGFSKTLELYNLDKLLTDEQAMSQVKETGRVLIVEGCFDVAKLIEAGIWNVVATFGAHLAETQLPRLQMIAQRLPVQEFIVWYDRDDAGQRGQESALSLLAETGIRASGFDWKVQFTSAVRTVSLPDSVGDPCDMTIDQLQWLRKKGVV